MVAVVNCGIRNNESEIYTRIIKAPRAFMRGLAKYANAGKVHIKFQLAHVSTWSVTVHIAVKITARAQPKTAAEVRMIFVAL